MITWWNVIGVPEGFSPVGFNGTELYLPIYAFGLDEGDACDLLGDATDVYDNIEELYTYHEGNLFLAERIWLYGAAEKQKVYPETDVDGLIELFKEIRNKL